MAKLPSSKKMKRIADMNIGETCFTTPLAMWVNLNEDCFLNENCEASDETRNDLKLKVLKLIDGYIVFIYEVTSNWSPRESYGFATADESLCNGVVLGFRFTENDVINLKIQQAVAVQDYELAAELQKQLKSE
jgi:hypothetical protein